MGTPAAPTNKAADSWSLRLFCFQVGASLLEGAAYTGAWGLLFSYLLIGEKIRLTATIESRGSGIGTNGSRLYLKGGNSIILVVFM